MGAEISLRIMAEKTLDRLGGKYTFCRFAVHGKADKAGLRQD